MTSKSSITTEGNASCYGGYAFASVPVFRLSEGYFLRLQNAFDTLAARRQVAKDIARIKPYKSIAA